MIPSEAVELILDAEGLDQPGQWPGGQSGITLGAGYDLGFYSAEEFAHDWSAHLSAEPLARLKTALGKTGGYAKRIAPEFRDIRVTRAAALEVFTRATLPKFEAQTRAAFPGIELLPALALGALVSLVFNRGPGMAASDRRREMRAIRSAIASFAALTTSARAAGLRILLLTIAAQLRSMKRIWQDQGLDGLLLRRENEARLMERAAAAPID